MAKFRGFFSLGGFMELDNDQAAVSGQGNFEQQGTGEPVGQPPEGTEQPAGEPQAQQPTTEQPATGKESVEITPEKYAELETNYKNLQTIQDLRNFSNRNSNLRLLVVLIYLGTIRNKKTLLILFSKWQLKLLKLKFKKQ
jgi:hypothetical protein